MMRLLVTTLLLCTLTACGTEVGNGFKPDDKKEESNRSGSGATTDEMAGDTETTSGSANVDWTYFLFATCASPFSETVAPRYVSGEASLDTQVSGNDITVTMKNAPFSTTPPRTGTITRATDTAFAFDIRAVKADELLPTVTTATCGTVSSNTTASGGGFVVTRTVDVTFLGAKASVSWRLEGASPGVVRAMTVTFSDGTSHTFAAP